MNKTVTLDQVSLSGGDASSERFDVLGVRVNAVDQAAAASVIESWIASRRGGYVCVTGVHGVMESHDDPGLKRIHNEAGLVVPDGVPLVWIGRLLGHGGVSRVYGPDLMLEVCHRSPEKGYRHYLYGGAPGVADKLADRLTQRYPGLNIVGRHCPPFRELTEEEDREIVQQINDARPDIVWVGLSTPKQERWMAAHAGRLEAPALLGVGAAFDFNAGLKKQAPSWIQNIGMEWFFRMVTEPRRLARRYLRNNPRFVCLMARRLVFG